MYFNRKHYILRLLICAFHNLCFGLSSNTILSNITSNNDAAESFESLNLAVNPLRPTITNTTVVSSCAIFVSWDVESLDESDHNIDHFMIDWNHLEDGISSSEFMNTTNDDLSYEYIIEDLLPSSEYVIVVSSYLENDEHLASEPSNVTTFEPLPPPDITKLLATQTKDSQTTLIWRVSYQDVCTIDFKINWTSQVLWDDDTTTNGDTKTKNQKYTVTNLVPYSNNTFCVTAYNYDDVYGQMECVVEQTDEGKPGEPVSLSAETRSSSSIYVSWAKPEDDNGLLSDYVVSWMKSESDEPEGSKNSTITKTLLENLSDCSTYTVSVSATTKNGALVGDPATVNANTLATIPTPPVSNLNATRIRSTSVKLVWTPPATNCEIDSYTLSVSGEVLWKTEFDNKTISINGTASSFVVQDLIPYTSYNMCIIADPQGHFSNATCLELINTDQDEPSEPTDLTAFVSSSKDIRVNWSLPEEANGVLSSYIVSWVVLGTVWQITDDDTTLNTFYTVENLMECTIYQVTINATTDDGKRIGNGAITEAETLPLVPTPPARNLSVSNVMERSLEISWTRPDTWCDIYNYTLKIEGHINWNEEQDNQTRDIDGKSVFYYVHDLIPYSNYTICIIAHSAGGISEPSCQDNVETLQDAPTSPNSVIADPLSKTTINVTWSEPREKNGENLVYNLRWFEIGFQNDSRLAKTSKLWYVMEDLHPCIDYNISLTATTDGGSASPVNLSQQAEEEEPPEPKMVNCKSFSSESILVDWSPSNTNCEIKYYIIEAVGEVLWQNQSSDTKEVSSDANNVNLVNLMPYTKYNLTVYAVTHTGKIGSDSKPCVATTFQAAPGPPTKLKINKLEKKSIEISWMPPKITNGIMEKYFITCDNKTNEVAASDSDILPYTYIIDNLGSGETYLIEVRGKTGSRVEGESSDITGTTLPSYNEANVGLILGLVVLMMIIVAIASASYIYRDEIKKKMKAPLIKKPVISVRPEELSHFSTCPILIQDLRKHITKFESTKVLENEFRMIGLRSYKGSTVEADKPINRLKNRYSNILPFDANRVILRNRESTYINASFVSSFSKQSFFIAAQGPKDNTMDDFWYLVWQEHVSVIVMLTSCEESGQTKCAQYWPMADEFNNKVVSDFLISNENEETNNVLAARIFEVTSTQAKKDQIIKQFQYLSWPDFGIPSKVEPILEFIATIKKNLSKNDGKILVHCSAGVGRTGVFIALWNLIEEVDSGAESISVLEQVLGLRRQRTLMVQTEEQYYFLHKCIATYCENIQRYQVEEKVLPHSRAIRTDHGMAYTNLAFEPIGDKDFVGNLI